MLHIVDKTPAGIGIRETLTAHPLGFYATQAYCYHTETDHNSIIETWHRRLGHPGMSMFHKIIQDTKGIPNTVHPRSLKDPCLACSQGKMTTMPSSSTTKKNIPNFLERLHADVCGPINPPSGPFQFFLAIIDASTKWSQVSLLSTHNLVFSRILAHIL